MTKNKFLAQAVRDYKPAHVLIDAEAMDRIKLPLTVDIAGVAFPFEAPAWDGSGYARTSAEKPVHDTVAYLLAMTALQFRFWSFHPGTGTFERYERDGAIGSTALSQAFAQAWGPDTAPGESIRMASLSVAGVQTAFGTNLQEPQQRYLVLNEVLGSPRGTKAVEEVLAYLVQHKRVDLVLAGRVAELLPIAYGDPYLKKAMLFLGFVAGWLSARVHIELDLCAYADYQVPSVLRHYGVLRYSDALAAKVDSQELLASGGPEELAIRSATILACEQMAELNQTTAAAVDWWCFQQRKLPARPFHLTETSNY